ncbi:EcsC family protein [Acetobacter conturbans]|uniref:Peptidase n=1 Tax=Acetobacter conturbans TaxID=1737472 RepID=A0ABX0JWL8_9PROT|nr:EcsC family protein [Acetobacter conturbans]NHN87812.1 hypothetical protein [Acetobacter conturbans]
MTLSTGSALAPLALTDGQILELEQALNQVEAGRGVLVRMADLMGGAVGHATRLGLRGLGMTPRIQEKLQGIAETAITRAFDIAVVGMSGPIDAPSSGEATDAPAGKSIRDRALQAAVAVSGAVGGFAGIAGLAPDIGFTTVTIMREIARIARQEGEDLSDPDARRACLEVFALRAFPNIGEGRESELGYFSARTVLRGRPVVMLISEVASHYGLALGHKIALQIMPVAGALCGASLNAAFLAHYQALARAHFTIRRLEREHGPVVRDTAVVLRDQVAARTAAGL